MCINKLISVYNAINAHNVYLFKKTSFNNNDSITYSTYTRIKACVVSTGVP